MRGAINRTGVKEIQCTRHVLETLLGTYGIKATKIRKMALMKGKITPYRRDKVIWGMRTLGLLAVGNWGRGSVYTITVLGEAYLKLLQELDF